MNYKRIIGWVTLTVGIVFIGYALVAMQRIAKAKEAVQGMTSLFEGTPLLGNGTTAQLKHQISQYDTIVMWILIIGFIFTIGGVLLSILYRKKS